MFCQPHTTCVAKEDWALLVAVTVGTLGEVQVGGLDEERHQLVLWRKGAVFAELRPTPAIDISKRD